MKDTNDVVLTTPEGTMVFTKNEVDTWTGDVHLNSTANNAIYNSPNKAGLYVRTDDTLEVWEYTDKTRAISARKLTDRVDLKQNIDDTNLVTKTKIIVPAINEIYQDALNLDSKITVNTNDIKGINGEIRNLKFQNFDLSFQTIPLTETTFSLKLIGKITVGNDSLYNSVWSIISTANNLDSINLRVQDIGNQFTCFPLNGVIDDARKTLTGVWTGDDFPIQSIAGFEIEEPDPSHYNITFYDMITSNNCTISIDYTPLLNVAKKEPKKYLDPSNALLLDMKERLEKLEKFNTMLMQSLEEK